MGLSIYGKKIQYAIRLIFICSLVALAYGLFRQLPPERIFENSDKVGHFLAFLVVPFTGRLALHQLKSMIYWSMWLILAIALEYLQGELRPQRHFSIADAYANALGVITAIGCSALLNQHIEKNRAKQQGPTG